MVLETFINLIHQGSYFAVFIASFISSSTILVPVLPSYLPILVGIGIGLNPLLVGLISGAGSVFGDLLGYLVGMGGSATIEKFEKKTPKFLKRFERFYSHIGFWVVLTFAFLPLPFDIIGVLSGGSKYNFKRFLLALIIGRTARTLLIAYGGFYALPAISGLFSLKLN